MPFPNTMRRTATTFAFFAFAVSAWACIWDNDTLAQEEKGKSGTVDRYPTARLREAREALAANDFSRAEKLALAVMQGAASGETSPEAARIYAECRFRFGGYEEAHKGFAATVRPNSDKKVSLMMAICLYSLGKNGINPLSDPQIDLAATLKSLQIPLEAAPPFEDRTIEARLGYAWFVLSTVDKGQLSLEDLTMAERHVKKNIAIAWLKGVRLLDLGRYREARTEFQLVVKSKFEDLSDRAKKKVAECSAKIQSG